MSGSESFLRYLCQADSLLGGVSTLMPCFFRLSSTCAVVSPICFCEEVEFIVLVVLIFFCCRTVLIEKIFVVYALSLLMPGVGGILVRGLKPVHTPTSKDKIFISDTSLHQGIKSWNVLEAKLRGKTEAKLKEKAKAGPWMSRKRVFMASIIESNEFYSLPVLL